MEKMSKSVERRLAIQEQNNDTTCETFDELAETSKKYNNLSAPEMLTIDKAFETILKEQIEKLANLEQIDLYIENERLKQELAKLRMSNLSLEGLFFVNPGNLPKYET